MSYMDSSDCYKYPQFQIYVTSIELRKFREISDRFVSFSYEEIEKDIAEALREYRQENR